MGRYSDLLATPSLARVLVGMERDERGRALRGEFPEMPAEYLDFLTEIGWGNIGPSQESCWFKTYGLLIDPSEFFGPDAVHLQEYRLWGDDFTGYTMAYHIPTWTLSEIDARGRPEAVTWPTFEEFIRQKVADIARWSNDQDT